MHRRARTLFRRRPGRRAIRLPLAGRRRPRPSELPTSPPARRRRLHAAASRRPGRRGRCHVPRARCDWQRRRLSRWITDLHRPQRPLDALEIVLVGDVLMPQELRPRANRSVRQVLHRALPDWMPSGRRLRGSLPQEGIPAVAVPIGDHVAIGDSSADARPRTCCGPGSSGSQSPDSNSAGDRPSRADLARPNQRRTPKSL